jgi:hypothetical protein
MRAHLLGPVLCTGVAALASLAPLGTRPNVSQDMGPESPVPAEDAPAPAPDLVVTWADGHPPILIPRGEHLEFRVRAGVAGLEAPVGTVTMDAGVEPYRAPLLLLGPGSGAPAGESGRMRIHAEGDYQLFRMDATIETLAHPVRWPFLVYNFTQTGSKDRRQELLLGWEDERSHARYRTDTTKGAPAGTRIWKQPKGRDLPVPALDMVSATYLARALVRENRLFMSFPVVNTLDIWEVSLRRGRTGRVETGAGTFEALQIILDPRPFPGEVEDEDVQEKAKEFEGLFGLHGSISFWVQKDTGVPIKITGEIPVGPIDVTVTIVLKSYAGTPAAFRPVGA